MIEKPFLFLVIAILLVGSLTMLVMGLTKSEQQATSSFSKDEDESLAVEKNGGSVSQFFEDEFDKSGTVKDDEFLKNDPFKDACAEVSGDGQPSISSNTVCLR
ncbi:hypothetical protein KKB40_06170 [Patescibacteria group bacterium]|nr:hypothetical protein [Patescibacteria group bacterium]